MQVLVIDHYNDGCRRVFEGSEEVIRSEILHAYPWLVKKVGWNTDLNTIVSTLDQAQAHSAVIQGGDLVLDKAETRGVVGDMLGWHGPFETALEAMSFLTGETLEPGKARLAMLDSGEDPERAALLAYGWEPTEENLKTLRAIVAIGDDSKGVCSTCGQVQNDNCSNSFHINRLGKSEVPQFQSVVAVTQDGKQFEVEVQRALVAGTIESVNLVGRHSAGTFITQDPEENTQLLLKPGSGPQNPSAGEAEVGASQAKREVAFYAVALSWGLGNYLPETHLLLLDGKEYAAMRLLPWSFQNMNKIRATDPGAPRRMLHMYLYNGALHRWAVLDYVLGNPDRNAGNVMARGGEVLLIDHGSALAGPEFAPATDRSSFVPFYLRALASADFERLSPEEKLHALPRLPTQEEPKFLKWLAALDEKAMETDLFRYGIDPQPELDRLRALKADAGHIPADLAINGAWTLH